MRFLFSDHLLDTDRRELRRGAAAIALEPQVFDLLVYLLENRDRVVSKDDLIASIWDGRIVSDSSVTSRINAARKAVDDNGEKQDLIRTFPRKGFRFVGNVREDSSSAAAAATASELDRSAPRQTIHFATTSDGVRIAYGRSARAQRL